MSASWSPDLLFCCVCAVTLQNPFDRIVTSVVFVALATACSSGAASAPEIVLRTDTPVAVIDVTGLSGRQLDALAQTTPTEEQWVRLVRVTVKPAGDAPRTRRPSPATTRLSTELSDRLHTSDSVRVIS
jgi:hypothetical protein